eukprot:m51a1_g13540 hypothetical protein (177) ;mRNA; f:996-1825
MQVYLPNAALPPSVTRSIFLAGPTPRAPSAPSWRVDAVRLLAARGYDGAVFSPESPDYPDYDAQVDWETTFLNAADCILFWVPREVVEMPGFTTNTEWGVWQASGKAVWGSPPWAAKVRYQRHQARALGVPLADTLEAAVDLALEMVGAGSPRSGPEVMIPLHVWRAKHFQSCEFD